MKRRRSIALLATAAAALSVALPARAPAAFEALTFTSSPTGLYTGDPEGGMTPETLPAQVSGKLRLSVSVDPPWCDAEGRYAWSADGHPAPVEQRGPCTFELTFAKPGSHRIALSARVGGETATATREVSVNGRVIVVIGDSIASGEGVPDVPGRFKAALWQSGRCHRSARAAPALAAAQLQERDPQTVVTFVSVACSGATIDDGILGEYEGIAQKRKRPLLVSQMTELAGIEGRRPVDAVIISIGANDIGFGGVVKRCALHLGDCFKRSTAALERLPSGYERLGRKLQELGIPPGRVYLMQYFNPTLGVGGASCSRKVLTISGAALARATSDVLNPLNEAGADAAAKFGWKYVGGIDSLFSGHGYCMRGAASWVTRVTASIFGEHGFAGTMHPNAEGHRQIAKLLADELSVEPRSPCNAHVNPCQPAPRVEEVSDSVAEGLVAGGGAVAAALSAVFLTRNAFRWRRGHHRMRTSPRSPSTGRGSPRRPISR